MRSSYYCIINLMNDSKEQNMQPNQPPKKSIVSEQLVQDMLNGNTKFIQEQRVRIKEAKLKTPDKEPFDIKKFADVYNLRDADGKFRITPELVQEFEADYYLKNPTIKSLVDFAKRRQQLDREEAS